MSPTVSAIVPTWNEGKYLPALLESLRSQTVPPLEILIADSGSLDDTARVAAGAGAHVLTGDRKGPGEGRNRGARAARGDVLLFADADCVLPPNLIETVLLALTDPDVAGGATGFWPADGTAADRFLFFLGNAYQRALTLWGLPHNAGYCFFFRRKAFERLGGMREELLLNETHDIAMRSRAIGRFVVLPLMVRTSMRRFRVHGYAQTIVREYLASTLVFYLTGRSPAESFRPEAVR